MFAGWATLHEIRAELVKLRASGKKVFAFMVEGDTRQYFVASAADKVYVDPAGGIRLQGFAGTSLYFAGLFEKIGVQAQFQRIGEYKSAPESFTRTGPTEPAFRMRNELYDSLYNTLVQDISASRGLSEQRMRTLITDLLAAVISRDVDWTALPPEGRIRVYDVAGSFVHDCEVCCHPWQVTVWWEEGERYVSVARADGSD